MPFSLTYRRYWADLWTAPLCILILAVAAFGPAVLAVPAGLLAWTFAEYAAHRWVLHGRSRFAAGHRDHHRNPGAFIGASPLVAPLAGTLALFATCVWAPLGLFGCGLLLGYLCYFAVHSALHHAPPFSSHPLRRALDRHMRHHGAGGRDFGIVFPFWDRVFGTAS